ncbi:aminotransferase class V-fold PLP-dependent enzyme [Bifidobacterium sp. 82T24]|uniref:threonine aldolase family protein n=1 Tax=Bifidobacterium pluvialisilvae TaxID=2834436 RepID=UPI001C59C528|nr:aminotransferase class V-fold PLP-dependent enzyme [Bifidobacterium pluvialisilvae]MBW3087406.1 aminotransferase class V-fold PLP-dependent enzyme [Bifidobacterium pluvialisilvae]
MLHFDSDYMEGAHPRILEELCRDNGSQHVGYGLDGICDEAKDRIRRACGTPDAEVWFLVGGTQTNRTVIDSILRPYEGVVAAESGHISVHEAGAIESSGHKVITLPQHDGKIDADELGDYLETFEHDENHDHMVRPGMTYISHPTEFGTLYSAAELREISRICHDHGILLYLDGARLGYGLAADDTDVTLHTVAECCDVFYIGGTKVGALFGEAVVITRPHLIDGFFPQIKLNGALLAKGWLLGLQFNTLFTDGLYEHIARNAIDQAMRIKRGFERKGYRRLFDSPTNQQFVILDDETMNRLGKDVSFSFWEKYDDDHTVVRFATSWATKPQDVDALLELL